ncbi:MAG TPA: hypothetical protein VFJ61_00330 [Solirubrobacterales bacterium]|nr:hypothetical protein [Solirubrobacterales bacterium]
MGLNHLKNYWGLVLVVLLAGLGSAILAGNGIVAVIASLGLVLLAVVIIGKRQSQSSNLEPRAQRAAGRPFSFHSDWSVEGPPDRVQLEAALEREGLTIEKSTSTETTLVLRGGSQLRTRLLGGYFVSPKSLPIRAEVHLPVNDGAGKVELRVEDSLGFGVRDGALRKRYELAADQLEQSLRDSMNDGSKDQSPKDP